MSTIIYLCTVKKNKLDRDNSENRDEESPFLTKIDGSLIFHLRELVMSVSRISNKRIEDFSIPIKMEQMPVLMSLYVHGDLAQQELADYIKRDKSSVYRTAKVLEKKGLIKYKKNKTDARKKLLSMTDAGKFIALKIEQSLFTIEDEISLVFTDTPKEVMINFLKDAREKLEKLENS